MRKGFVIIFTGFFLIATIVGGRDVQAQGVVDWNKRLREYKKAKGKEAEKLKKELPSWVLSMPKATTDEEKLYDVNDDLYLQIPEVIIFLRDKLDKIEEEGGVTVSSAILKEYDKNKDGFISKEEAKVIKEQVR